ncbi:hypothetical protein SASPL_155831 [Salvia splendens]|uniref:MFS transporter, PHS family, inorganic phosphate transporter n=1 Tax=Salvia splendens TaxID=180675 RepID=A0A8X8VXX7_SALSN|nr:hypothetical protein SASPL_155831 [Salvia splendens]
MGRQQLEVLNALDVAKTQLYHFTAIVVAGMGFFTDAYDHAAFSLIVSAALRPRLPLPFLQAERRRLMFGAIPAALTFYWRMKMPETARYTALVAKNATRAAQDMDRVLNIEIEAEEEKIEKISQGNNFGLLSKEFLKRHGLHLFGNTSTLFLLNIAFYSQNLFQKDVFSAIGWIPPAKTMNAIGEG